MNLETKLNNSLNDILKTSGYIFEIINNNKKSSNLITGTNNQLISPTIISQLSLHIGKFDEILDETVTKFNDAKWCIETMVDNKREEELKAELEKKAQVMKLEQERLKKLQDEKKQQELDKAEEERKKREEKEKEEKLEQERKEQLLQQQEKERLEKERLERERLQQKLQQPVQQRPPSMDLSPNFDFDLGVPNPDIPNPNDILSSMDYKGDMGDDMNSLLGNDGGLLDGLNMSLLDDGFDVNGGDVGLQEDFDVDNFINQFGGD